MKKAVKKTESRELNLLVRDAYLQPFADAIKGRHESTSIPITESQR